MESALMRYRRMKEIETHRFTVETHPWIVFRFSRGRYGRLTLHAECAVCCGTAQGPVRTSTAARLRMGDAFSFVTIHDHPDLPDPIEWCEPLLNLEVWTGTGIPIRLARTLAERQARHNEGFPQ
jgi:hypothetical protein